MKAIGVFLGVEPDAGGMFQYAQTVLEGLLPMHSNGIPVKVAYVGEAWKPLLDSFPFAKVEMGYGKFGLHFASVVMATRLPGGLARLISQLVNPVVTQMRHMDCEIWIFPSQDNLSYQVPFPVIATVHDLMHRYESRFPEVSRGGRFGMRDHRFRNLVDRALIVLVDSIVGREHVIESFGTDPTKVVPLPYVAPKYIIEPDPIDFDQRYLLPSKFIFYPAQFWQHKNHHRLVSAAALVRRSCPDIRLVFTGAHRHGYESLRQHANSIGMNDSIDYPGYVPNDYLAGFYRRARALVMPTFFGPTNIPPLEAFSCGCPVAVSDIYGMPEQSRGAALLFNPLSVDNMAEIIERIWLDDELCADLRQRGIAHATDWNQFQFGLKLRCIIHDALQSFQL